MVGIATLTDTADLTGGYAITGGSITFTLTDPNGHAVTLPAADATVAVDRPRPLPDAGRDHGDAGGQLRCGRPTYSGDALNLGAVEPNTSAELANETVTTIEAEPSITTVASESGNVVGSAHADGTRPT